MRRRLPDTRAGKNHAFNVGGHKGYLNVGLFEDGTPGELFITMGKDGSTVGGLMDSVAILTSVALQHGVPISTLANKFKGQHFEPCGLTTNEKIPQVTSITDYIFRWLEIEFAEESEVKDLNLGGQDPVTR